MQDSDLYGIHGQFVEICDLADDVAVNMLVMAYYMLLPRAKDNIALSISLPEADRDWHFSLTSTLTTGEQQISLGDRAQTVW